jgi:hypothetical protein
MPPVEEWRMTPSAGCLLSETNQVVRSNHFLVNTRQIPLRFYHYHLHIYRIDTQSDEVGTVDTSKEEDYRVTVALVAQFRKMHPEFAEVDGQRVGFVYDNRNCVVTTHELPLPEENSNGEPCVSNDVSLLNADGSESRKRFRLTLSYATTVVAPTDSRTAWAANKDSAVIRSLDLSLLAFARKQLMDKVPNWYLVGNKCFSEAASKLSVADGYIAMRGYTVGLRSCLAGLTLGSDVTVAVFLVGGPLINVVSEVCGFPSVDAFLKDAGRNGVDKRYYSKINEALKKCKVNVDHLVSLGLIYCVRIVSNP